MPKHAFAITIPQPCHENWEAMTPEQKGRFCAVCAKTVIDFSAMNDAEVYETLKGGGASLCGHFHTDQLNRTISRPAKPKWFLQPFWKYFMGLALFFKPPAAKAQGKPVCTPVEQTPVTRKLGMFVTGVKVNTERTIKGIITNDQHQPVPGATVTVVETKQAVAANESGAFTLNAKTGQTLEIIAPGFDRKIITLQQQDSLTIVLQTPLTATLRGEMLVVDGNIRCTRVPPVTLAITVTDKETGKPIKNANITWSEDDQNRFRVERTDRRGKMKTRTLFAQPELLFVISAPGYAALQYPYTDAAMNRPHAVNLELALEKEKKQLQQVEPVKLQNPELLADSGINVQTPNPLPVNDWVKALTGKVGGIVLVPATDKQVVWVEETVEPVLQTLAIYPNPITENRALRVEFDYEKAERLMVQVINAEGKILLNQRVEAVKGRNRVSLTLPNNTKPGTLTLKLMNSRGQWVNSGKAMTL